MEENLFLSSTSSTSCAIDHFDHLTMKRMIDKINGLSESEQFQIFNIIRENKQKFTENQNGVFVNFNQLNISTLQQIHHFINFFEKQKQTLENQNKLLETMETLVNGKLSESFPTLTEQYIESPSTPLPEEQHTLFENSTENNNNASICVEELNEHERVISGLLSSSNDKKKQDLSLNRLKPHYNGSSARIAKKCNYNMEG